MSLTLAQLSDEEKLTKLIGKFYRITNWQHFSEYEVEVLMRLSKWQTARRCRCFILKRRSSGMIAIWREILHSDVFFTDRVINHYAEWIQLVSRSSITRQQCAVEYQIIEDLRPVGRPRRDEA